MRRVAPAHHWRLQRAMLCRRYAPPGLCGARHSPGSRPGLTVVPALRACPRARIKAHSKQRGQSSMRDRSAEVPSANDMRARGPRSECKRGACTTCVCWLRRRRSSAPEARHGVARRVSAGNLSAATTASPGGAAYIARGVSPEAGGLTPALIHAAPPGLRLIVATLSRRSRAGLMQNAPPALGRAVGAERGTLPHAAFEQGSARIKCG